MTTVDPLNLTSLLEVTIALTFAYYQLSDLSFKIETNYKKTDINSQGEKNYKRNNFVRQALKGDLAFWRESFFLSGYTRWIEKINRVVCFVMLILAWVGLVGITLGISFGSYIYYTISGFSILFCGMVVGFFIIDRKLCLGIYCNEMIFSVFIFFIYHFDLTLLLKTPAKFHKSIVF